MTWQHSIPGLMTRSIRVDVPLDHINVLDGRRLSIFARVVALPGGTGRPYLLFLQGGPGHESPRPS
ncbi:MAG: aminopeptidase, partial [Propionibacterium sp.]|nr:aminopeptidase [Propionibacterium sp.]